MISQSFSYKGLLTLAGIITLSCSENQTIYELSDSDDFSNQVLNLMKDELQLVNMELTKSFIANHVRKKRSLDNSNRELNLTMPNGGSEINLGRNMMNKYSLVKMDGGTFLMTENGTFKIGLLHESSSNDQYQQPNNHPFHGHENRILALLVSDWHPPEGEIILCNIYWRQTHFFLMTTKDRTFSQIYTSTGTNMKFDRPILRQQIKNHGQAIAAKFFVHKVNLYLLIANDNRLHSLSLCPLFRWEGTYMDEIHNIQTRGTKDIIVFDIDYVTYIVMAQSEDTKGNSEIGTQVIKMNDNEELEKVQLLWSNSPVALTYFPGFKEHFIIIGQRKEASILYWFGGFDFVRWQKLEDIMGDHIYFDVLSIQETKILLAASATYVKFYTTTILGGRTPTIVALDAIIRVAPHQRILGAKFLRLSDGSYSVSVEVAQGDQISLLMQGIEINYRPIVASQTREKDSKLSNCLETVKTILDATKDMIAPMNTLSSLVLTKDGAWDYHGVLVSESKIILNTKNTVTNSTLIKPHATASDAGLLPHKILDETNYISKLFHENHRKLKNVVRKSHPNDITGNLQFSKLDIENFKSHGSSLQIEHLNERPSAIIRSDALRKESSSPQVVTGVWWMKDLSAKTFVTSHWNKEIEANTKRFLQLNCQEGGHEEIVRSDLHFANMTFSHDLRMNAKSTINDVAFSNLVFRSFDNCQITGYKKSDSIHGIANFRPEYVNDVPFYQWMEQTIKLSAGNKYQNVTGTKVFEGNFVAENIDLGTVNNLHWEPFTQSVLFKNSNKPQYIEGNIKCINLDVGDATVTKFNAINISDFMRNAEYQRINSQIQVRYLHITNKDQMVHFINERPFSTFAILNETMEIKCPVVLENVHVENIYTKEGVTIGKQDIISMANLRKKLVIATKNASFYISKDVTAHSLHTDSINKVLLKDIPHSYWNTRRNNDIIAGQLDLSSRKVNTIHRFETRELNKLLIPQDFVDSNTETLISSRLSFTKTTVVNDKVVTAESVRLNNYDRRLPLLEQNIVRLGKKNKILGHKYFKDHCLAANSLNVTIINGLDFHKDLVLLSHHQNYHFTGKKMFHDIVATNLFTFSNIAVSNTVNRHYNLKHILNSTVTQSHYQHGRPIQISSDVVFNDTINASDMYVNEINGIHFSEDVLNSVFLNKPYNFEEIIIHGTTIFEKDSEANFLNNVPLHEYLNKVSRKNLPQFIRSHKEFKNVECDELVCPSINSIDLRKLTNLGFSKTRSQNITAPFMFSHMKLSGDLTSPHFSGIRVTDFAQNMNGHPMSINSDVEMLRGRNEQSMPGNPLKNYVKGHINGYNIKQLASQMASFPDHREFESIHVLGNIDWKRDSKSMNSLSYLNSHAMKKETLTPQTVLRNTFFKEHVSIKNLMSNEWIGGVNLKSIEEDSNWENSHMVLEGSKNVFHKFIAENGLKTNSCWFETVNNIKFRDFVDDLVLSDSSYPYPHSISGIKVFKESIKLGNIHTNGKNVFNEMVPVNSTKKPHFAHFHDAEIISLNPGEKIMSQLYHLLENRVNLEAPQNNITGNYTFNNLNVVSCDIRKLNDIRSTELLYTNYSQPQYIAEENSVTYLTVKGDVITTLINNRNLEYLHENSYHTNEKMDFSRPVKFTNTVRVENSLHVKNHSNFVSTHFIVDNYTSYLQKLLAKFPASDDVKQLAEYRIASLAKNSSSPVWLEYLSLHHEWTSFLFKIRTEHFKDKRKTILSFYDQRENNDIGLSKGCYCQTVDFLQIENEKISYKFDRKECQKAFLLKGQENIYALYSGALSYNDSCSKVNEKKSQLVMFNGDIPKTFTTENTIFEHATSVDNLEIGYIADAKVFSNKGIDYIILAQYYNSIEGKHDVPTIVYSVSKGKILKTQLINSYGARRLAIGTVGGYQILAIANSYNPDSSSCESHSSLLIWSEIEEQFLLLREIKTKSAMDVVFLSVRTKNLSNTLEFVAFAQNINSASSAVDIYQYDIQFKNFHIYQTINFEWDVKSLHAVSISEINYLVIVTQAGLLFYEYSFVEGFRPVFTIPITGATDVTSFVWHSRLYFAITSEKLSLLAEGLLSSPFTIYS